MSMNANLELGLWIAHPVLELGLAALMFKRKLHKAFPIFFGYIVFQVVNFAIVFPVYRYGSPLAYFYTYWISAALSLALGFKVIHEIFLDVFRPFHTLKDLGTVLFKWAALVMLMVALVMTAASQGGSESPLTQAVIIGQRCVRVIQCGLILFLLVFSKYLGVSWRQHSFGIALGFGSFASVELIVLALLSGGLVHSPTLSLINTGAYGLTILTWIGYAAAKGIARETTTSIQFTSQRWDKSLGDLRHPAGEDSLIPMFEGMVDRAFSRSPQEHSRRESEDVRSMRPKPPTKVTPLVRQVLPKDLVR